MGYDKESLVQIAMNSPEFDGKFELTRGAAKKLGGCCRVAGSPVPLPASGRQIQALVAWQTKHGAIEFSTIAVHRLWF